MLGEEFMDVVTRYGVVGRDTRYLSGLCGDCWCRVGGVVSVYMNVGDVVLQRRV